MREGKPRDTIYHVAGLEFTRYPGTHPLPFNQGFLTVTERACGTQGVSMVTACSGKLYEHSNVSIPHDPIAKWGLGTINFGYWVMDSNSEKCRVDKLSNLNRSRLQRLLDDSGEVLSVVLAGLIVLCFSALHRLDAWGSVFVVAALPVPTRIKVKSAIRVATMAPVFFGCELIANRVREFYPLIFGISFLCKAAIVSVLFLLYGSADSLCRSFFRFIGSYHLLPAALMDL